MRGTWIILGIMIIVGAGMYFYFTRKPKPIDHDSIVFQNTPDSIVKKMKVYIAMVPTEVMYKDSVWMQQDSTPLKLVAAGNIENRLEKLDTSVNIYLTYDEKYFYDLELKKPNPKLAYRLNFQIQPQNNDTFLLEGMLEPQQGDVLAFQAPMMKIYPQFVITYNSRLPQQPFDSTKIEGHQADKTITVLEHE